MSNRPRVQWNLSPTFEASAVVGALLNSKQVAVALADSEGIILDWSSGAEAIFGVRDEDSEALKHSLHALVPTDPLLKTGEILDRISRGEAVEPYDAAMLNASHKPVEVQISLTAITSAEDTLSGILAFLTDVTARREAEDKVRTIQIDAHHRTVIIETANRVALDIMSSRTGVEALRSIADAARVLAGARYSALGVARLDELGQQELELFVTVGITAKEQERIGPLPRGRGILGLLLQRSEPLRIDNLADHPASVGFPANHPPMSSFLGVPIRRGNDVMGSLYLTDKQGGGAFTEADEIAVQALGAHVAIAIHNLHMIARQQALTRSLLTAQEEERRAIAYDLHDGLTQYVMGAHAHFQAFGRARREGNSEKADRDAEAGSRYLKEAVVESRRLVNNLRLLVLDDLGLAGALEQLLHEEASRAGWTDFVLDLNFEKKRFERTLETATYRIVQEALTNARKHAATSRVLVALRYQDDETGQAFLEIQVRDWGRGFVAIDRNANADHVGLQGINERVQLLNGAYDMQSAPDEGTMLRVTLPVVAAPATETVSNRSGGPQ